MRSELRGHLRENNQKRDSTEGISVIERLSNKNRKGIRIPETVKFLLVNSGILGFGTRKTAKGIRNSTNDCNPESKFH